MVQRVELPDGTIGEFPDDMGDDAIAAVLAKQFPPQVTQVSAKTTPAAAQKNDTPNRRLFKSLLGEGAGEAAGDIAAGVGKTVSGAANTMEDFFPPTALIKAARGGKRNPVTQSLQDYTKDAYDEAGPLATAANVAGDIALTGPAAGAVGKATMEALPAATSAGGRVLKAAAGGSTAGATGAGLLDPGEDGSRLQNAGQGAALGLAAGGVSGAIDPALKYVKRLFPNATSAAARAREAFKKALGSEAQMGSIASNLENPRALPMTTAAASQNPGLAQIESSMRANISPRTRSRWEGTDERTSAAAWDKFQDATGRATKLDELTSAHREALAPAQAQLDKIPIKAGQRTEFNNKLQGLKDSQLFITNDKAKMEINRLMANVMNKKARMGALAQYETDLASNGAFNGAQKSAMRNLIRSTLDDASGGAWSKAHDTYKATGDLAKEAGAANKMVNDFMGEGGVVRGATGNEIPKVTSSRVRNAMNKQVENKGTLEARDPINPDDKDQLEFLVRALQQAEYPRSVPAGKGINTGSLADSLSNLPTGSMTGRAARTALRTVTGRRDDATMKAMEMALRSPRGWEAMEKLSGQAISADDAALLARILRSGTAAGVVGADN